MIATWDDRLSTGNAIIDAEHRQVLDLLNELDVAFTVGAPPVVVERALEALIRAVNRHFARDGQVSEAPLGGWVADHAALASRFHRLLKDWRSGTVRVVDRRTLLALGHRWIDHIGRRENPAAPPFPTALAG